MSFLLCCDFGAQFLSDEIVWEAIRFSLLDETRLDYSVKFARFTPLGHASLINSALMLALDALVMLLRLVDLHVFQTNAIVDLVLLIYERKSQSEIVRQISPNARNLPETETSPNSSFKFS